MFEPIYIDGKPCEHPGCMNHVTHPCENCHRIQAGQNHYYQELYHGTNEIFDKFDPKKLNSDCAIDQYGSGFYFYDCIAPTIRHGSIVTFAKCHIKRILNADETDNYSLTFRQVEELILYSQDLDICLTNFGDVEYESWDNVFYRAVDLYHSQDILHSLNTIGKDFFQPEECHILLKKFVEMTGFNCIKKEFEDNSIYVMLDERDIEIVKQIPNEELP